MAGTPTKEGFFWAKWEIADDDTHEADQGILSPDKWEVVGVFDNNGEGDDAFRAFVPGVRESQHINNFFWGEEVKQ